MGSAMTSGRRSALIGLRWGCERMTKMSPRQGHMWSVRLYWLWNRTPSSRRQERRPAAAGVDTGDAVSRHRGRSQQTQGTQSADIVDEVSRQGIRHRRPNPPDAQFPAMAEQGTPRTGVPPRNGGAGMMERLLVAGTSACIADAITFPLDTAKVRLQVQGETSGLLLRVSLFYEEAVISAAAPPKYQGMLGTMRTIAVEEGFKGLYKGLGPGLQRQMAFSAIKLGMYDTFKELYHSIIGSPSQNYVNIPTRVMAGMTTGALAVMVAQPTDVVKVRMQAQGAAEGAPRYRTSLQAYSAIFRTEGVRGLWKGFVPNVMRNAIVNVSETVCYDVTKDLLLYYSILQNGIPLHFTSAAAAGLCATVVASPVDVIKTRYMNAAPGEYRSALDAAYRMAMQEGPAAFYKGFLPSFCRLVSWNICMWLTYEQVKEMVKRRRESS